jgi:DNA-binding IscR family transcriptional regulator
MTDAELGQILKAIDSAIDIYRTHEGRLSAPEISVKSMLMAVRNQVAAQLQRKEASKDR